MIVNAIKNKQKFEDQLNKLSSDINLSVKELFRSYIAKQEYDLAKELLYTYFDELDLEILIEIFINSNYSLFLSFNSQLIQNKFKLNLIKSFCTITKQIRDEINLESIDRSSTNTYLENKINDLIYENNELKERIRKLENKLNE